MKIGLPADVPEESLSKKRRVEAEASKVDEAHSSRAPSPAPSFLSASIQVQIQEALKPVIQQILKNNQVLMADIHNQVQAIHNQVQAVIGGVDNNFQALYKLQANYLQQLVDIRHRLDCLETHLTGGPLSRAPVLSMPTYTHLHTASPPQSTVPSTSPTQAAEPSNILFSMQDHPSSSPVDITLDPSQQETIPSPNPTPQTHPSQPKEVPDSQHDSPILTPQALGSPHTPSSPVASIPLPSTSNPPQAPLREQPSSSTT